MTVSWHKTETKKGVKQPSTYYENNNTWMFTGLSDCCRALRVILDGNSFGKGMQGSEGNIP